MKEEDIIKDAREAEEELEHEEHHKEQKHTRFLRIRHMSTPAKIISGTILLLLILLMSIPYYGVKLDPEPKNIPRLKMVLPNDIEDLAWASNSIDRSRQAYIMQIIPNDPAIRNMAVKIVTSSCPESQVCYAKALFYFVRDQLNYVADPPNDYIESPFETLYSGGADCDGLTILLANLVTAIGIPSRFTFIPGHVFLQVKIDDAPRGYKDNDGWIAIDPACTNCGFGELSYKTKGKERSFIYI